MADEFELDIAESDMTEPKETTPEERARLFGQQGSSGPPPGSEEDAPSASESAGTPEEATSSEPDSDNKVGMVPHQALHEERQRRKEMEQQLNQMKGRFEEFQKRLQTFQDEKDAPPQPEIPSFDEDPATNLNERLRRQEEAAKKFEQETAQDRQLRQQREQIAAFERGFQAKEVEFANKNPDYYQATEFLRSNRFNELQALGYPEDQARQILDAEALNYAITAANNGRDPVELFYTIAKQRGFKASSNGSGGADSTVDLQQVRENMERSQSMGSRGGTPKESFTFDDLANMSDDEFDKATSGDNWAQLWR